VYSSHEIANSFILAFLLRYRLEENSSLKEIFFKERINKQRP